MKVRLTMSWLVGALACTPELEVPPGAQISCTSAEECPEGYVCRLAAKRCAPAEVEATPPGLEAVQLSRDAAGRGVTVFVDFDVNTELARPPEVRLTNAGGTAWALVEQDGLHYRFALTPDGSEGEGSWAIVADLVDAAGTSAPELAVGTVRLDFTLPQLASVVSVPAAVALDETTQLTLTTSEPVFAPSVHVSFATELDLGVATQSTDTSFTIAYTAGLEARDGAAPLRVELEDLAGNRNVAQAAAAFTVDITPPAVLGESVQLFLDAAGLYTPATRATNGTLVRVSFSLSEPLAGAPAVTLGPAALPMQAVISAGTFFAYELELSGLGSLEEVWDLEASFADVVGNPGDAVLARLVVDTVAPAPPDVADAGALVLYRAPWGTRAAATPVFEVRGGAVEVDALLPEELLLSPSPEAGLVLAHSGAEALGEATADATGAFTRIPLVRNRSEVWLTVVDRAGNASPAVRVRDGLWLAALNGKQAGSTLHNPHRLSETTWLEASLHATTTRELDPDDGVALLDSTTHDTASHARWSSFEGDTFGGGSGGDAPARYGHRLAYDNGRGMVVLFGGRDPARRCGTGDNTDCAETWAFSGSGWARLETVNAPPARADFAMAYHQAEWRTYVYGGCDDDPVDGCTQAAARFTDTWVFDGDWTQVASGGPDLVEPALTYDAARRRLWLVGERPSDGRLASYWLDGATWQVAAPATLDAFGARLDYDDASDRLRLYGGASPSFIVTSLDPAAPTAWTGSPQTTPTGRTQPSWVYDAAAAGFLLFGGLTPGLGCDDTGDLYCPSSWRWRNDTWERLTPTTARKVAPPVGRHDHASAYFGPRDGTLITGGTRNVYDGSSTSLLSDTWLLETLDGRPAQLFEVALASAEIDDPSRFNVAINFGPDGVAAPAEYLADFGEVFAAHGAYLYGWEFDTRSHTRLRRDRDSPDVRYDSFAYMQSGGVPHRWELAVPYAGLYRVAALSGDPRYGRGTFDSGGVIAVAAEGAPFLAAQEGAQFHTAESSVDVQDGALTLQGSVDGTALNFAHVYSRTTPLQSIRTRWYAGASSFVTARTARARVYDGTYEGSGAANLTRSFVLPSFLDRNANGVWRLIVENRGPNAATINSWCLSAGGAGPTCSTAALPVAAYRGASDRLRLAGATSLVTTVTLTVDATVGVNDDLSIWLEAEATTTSSTDEVVLYGWTALGWRELTSLSGTGDLDWQSAPTDLLEAFVLGPEQLMRFAVAPRGGNGVGAQAQLASDAVDVEVRYRLP